LLRNLRYCFKHVQRIIPELDFRILIKTLKRFHGDGMNAYMAYKVTTKLPKLLKGSEVFLSLSVLSQTSMSLFKQRDFSVKRRFSDFLGLHSKLASKYLHIGYIVPPAPEKSIVGMTKVKVGKEDQSSNEFVEKRRSALERKVSR
ncbi:sorting nexin-2, partial [Xenoophorus captivus]